jgi:AraC-like DNA-binding protein
MSEIIFLGSIFCSLITAYILSFKVPTYQQFSGRLLSTVMVFYAWSAISYLLIRSGWLAEVPFLFKTGATVGLLTPALTYLYVKSVLYDKQRFEKKDFLHFIPFVIGTLNYLPIYLMPSEEKRIIVQKVISDFSNTYLLGNGWIPDSYFFTFRMLLTLGYLIAQFKIVHQYDLEQLQPRYLGHTHKVFNWLKVLNWSFLASFLGYVLLFGIILVDPSLKNSSDIVSIPAYVLSLSFLQLSSYLLLHPEVLFGLPYIQEKNWGKPKENLKPESTTSLVKDYSNEIKILKEYFEGNRPYLNADFNIAMAAVETKISSREISFIMNQHFNQRFTEFVNTYRIQYANAKIKEGYLDHYTLESLFKEAGFSSKTTFNKAFKKVNNCTPSEYIVLMLSKPL